MTTAPEFSVTTRNRLKPPCYQKFDSNAVLYFHWLMMILMNEFTDIKTVKIKYSRNHRARYVFIPGLKTT